jgi:ADP-heptose:LPS heptosyltransferase/GT2 family glycosyltransferase
MKRFMKLERIGSSVYRVVAVITSSSYAPVPPGFHEVPPSRSSEKNIVGSIIFQESGDIPKPKSLVSFIIPTYHAGEKLERCLETLFKHHRGRMDFEVIVSFDGGPYEERCRSLCTKYGARIVSSKENGGFSVAVNRGIRACSPSSGCVILVNDDLWFDSPAGTELASFLETFPDTAIVGARLLYPNGKVQHAGIAENTYHIGAGLPSNQRLVVSHREAWAVTGALYAISRRFLDQVHGMDERFRMAWEDVDLCMTARFLGWKVWYCGTAWAFHEEGGTRGKSPQEKESRNPLWSSWEKEGASAFDQKWPGFRENLNWRTQPSRPSGKLVVVRRTTALGDVLLVTPVVRAIKRSVPDARVAVSTMHGFIFRDNPDVSFVVPQDHRWITLKEYDVFYDLDLAYESRPSMGIVDAYASVCGVRVEDPWPVVYLRDHDRAFARDVLGDGKWAVLHAQTSGWPGKDWFPDRYASVSERLRRMGWRVVLVGTGKDSEIPCDLDLRGRTSFHELAAVIERSGIYVGKDSMPMHLAQAFRKPIVALFGSIDPSHVLVGAPFTRAVTADSKKVDCLGCHHRRPPPRTTGYCHRDQVYCMEYLHPDQVIEAVKEVIAHV